MACIVKDCEDPRVYDGLCTKHLEEYWEEDDEDRD